MTAASHLRTARTGSRFGPGTPIMGAAIIHLVRGASEGILDVE